MRGIVDYFVVPFVPPNGPESHFPSDLSFARGEERDGEVWMLQMFDGP